MTDCSQRSQRWPEWEAMPLGSHIVFLGSQTTDTQGVKIVLQARTSLNRTKCLEWINSSSRRGGHLVILRFLDRYGCRHVASG
jgi:hypothetical protein